MTEALFAGKYPCGLVFADRRREVAGDYKRAAFMPYDTLEVDFDKSCPADLREPITRIAADVQRQAGKPYQISTSGQSILLGVSLSTEQQFAVSTKALAMLERQHGFV